MQEFAPIQKTSPPRGTCPSDEELAAYIDGFLEKEEADRITAHLAACEDCYAIYSGAVRFQLESDTDVVRFDPLRKKRWPIPATIKEVPPRQWLSIAALLLVGVGAGTYFQFLGPLPALVTAEVAKPVPPQPNLPGEFWLGETTRGGGDDEAVPVAEAPFRTGVQLVNLQVSLQAGKVGESQNVIAYLLNLLQPQLGTNDLQTAYTKITSDLANGKAPRDLLPEASRLATETREVFLADDDPSFDLGQWVEAARLAAIAQDPSFFKQGKTRSFLRRLLWREKAGLGEMTLDPAARESLQQISEIASKDLAESDYEKLRGQLDQILKIYYPET
jgi:hypothetical protein